MRTHIESKTQRLNTGSQTHIESTDEPLQAIREANSFELYRQSTLRYLPMFHVTRKVLDPIDLQSAYADGVPPLVLTALATAYRVSRGLANRKTRRSLRWWFSELLKSNDPLDRWILSEIRRSGGDTIITEIESTCDLTRHNCGRQLSSHPVKYVGNRRSKLGSRPPKQLLSVI